MAKRKDFDESTLWRISAYERLLAETHDSGFARLPDSTVLPTSLNAELSRLERVQRADDVLEIVAACVRHHESALVVLRLGGLVWPLTVFPQANHYHVPRDVIPALTQLGRDCEVLSVEPPGLRPPGPLMQEPDAESRGFRLMPSLLWVLALHTAGGRLLEEISGSAAFRIGADCRDEGMLRGAMQSSFTRLRAEVAAQRDIAHWPGMDAERAARLLNGAYLQGGLIVLRSHPAAHAEVATNTGLMSWLRRRH